MDAIRSADLTSTVESQLLQGLFDWCKEYSSHQNAIARDEVVQAADRYASAAQDEAASSKPPGSFTELELEFIDGLIALGPQDTARVRACVELGAVVPAHLWPAQRKSALEALAQAGFR